MSPLASRTNFVEAIHTPELSKESCQNLFSETTPMPSFYPATSCFPYSLILFLRTLLHQSFAHKSPYWALLGLRQLLSFSPFLPSCWNGVTPAHIHQCLLLCSGTHAVLSSQEPCTINNLFIFIGSFPSGLKYTQVSRILKKNKPSFNPFCLPATAPTAHLLFHNQTLALTCWSF